MWRNARSRSTSEDTAAALFDNVRTNPRYDRDAISRLPRSLRGRLRPLLDAGCLVMQTPQRARDESVARRRNHGDNVMVFFEAVLASRMAHWHKGIYLLAAKWERQGTDGSDALVGVNLGGAVAEVRNGELRPLEADGPGKPVRCLIGGPVGPEKLLALVPFEGRLEEPLPRLVHVVEGDAAGGQGCALFAEIRDVVQVLAQQSNLQPLGAAVFQGHAVWSSDQLMSEVARGSWGVARAHKEDLAVPEGDAQERWASLWQQREVVPRTFEMERPGLSLERGELVAREPRETRETQSRANPREAEDSAQVTSGCIGMGACTIS
ncbi:unnamed protein product [Effrenium voratum]|nr:unnamed protein product [Effrenium voratum]